MKTRKIAAVVLCVLSVVAIICFRLISAPLTGAVTAAELGSALGALSLLPTVLSVALAFLLGDVVVSLLIGLSVGELMLLLVTGEKGAAQLLQIVPSVIDELVGVASDTENTKVLILCALVGGLVGVLMKTGGFEAAAKRITKKVKTPRGANLLGQLFCVLFFFDDYANALITGPVLRPIADKVGLSRERLRSARGRHRRGFQLGRRGNSSHQQRSGNGRYRRLCLSGFPSLYPLLLLLHFCSCVHAHHQFHRQGIRPYAQSGAPRQSRAKRRMSEKL